MSYGLYLSYQAYLEKYKSNKTVELFSFGWEKIVHLLEHYKFLFYVPMMV